MEFFENLEKLNYKKMKSVVNQPGYKFGEKRGRNKHWNKAPEIKVLVTLYNNIYEMLNRKYFTGINATEQHN